jgi:hypothetical protein
MSTTVHRSASDGCTCTWSPLQAVASVHPDILSADVSTRVWARVEGWLRLVTVMRWLAQLARAISHPSGLRGCARTCAGCWALITTVSRGAAGIMVALRNLLFLLLSSTVLAVAPRAQFQVSAARALGACTRAVPGSRVTAESTRLSGDRHYVLPKLPCARSHAEGGATRSGLRD